MEITDAHKDHLYRKILEIAVESLKNNLLSKGELPEIADYVLQNLELATTEDEVSMFLSMLAYKWPIFKNLALVQTGESHQAYDNERVSRALELTKEGKIDEALAAIQDHQKE